MTKLELNDKLAELCFIPKATEIGFDNGLRQELLLIDDWSRLMDLAVDNEIMIRVNISENIVSARNIRWLIQDSCWTEITGHESPQAATRLSIAMALVKLKEDK